MSDPVAAPAPDSTPSVPMPAWAGALIGAAIGAVVWAAALVFMNMEHGIVAWGIGWLVGGGAYLCGGRGGGIGLICGVLAFASIGAGKWVGLQQVQQTQIDEGLAEMCSPEAHTAYLARAQALTEVETDTDLKGFLIEFELTAADNVFDVTDDEIALFDNHLRIELDEVAANPPAYDDWKSERMGSIRGLVEALMPSPSDAVIENLGALDLLFIGLGVYTAAKLGGSGGGKPAPRRTRRPSRSAAAKEPDAANDETT